MDPRLLNYYNRELLYLREMGAEFAEAYPKIASRLSLDGLSPADPYVERLVESFAFLAARVQLKLDARHPDFTQHLLELVYPQYLAPLPSCAVAELQPRLSESALKAGLRIPRGTAMRAQLAVGEGTSCRYSTAHDTVLWPLTVREARYVVGAGAIAVPQARLDPAVRGAIRIRLKTAGGLPVRNLPCNSLTFYIHATADLAAQIYEQVMANCVGSAVRCAPPGKPATLAQAGAVQPVGFEDDQALLPPRHASFQGYRLLQEYFAFPERFLFFTVDGIAPALATVEGDEFDLLLLLDRCRPDLDNALDAAQFGLHCTPIVNLFHHSLDRVHVAPFDTEHHLVPDRSRPMDFEVYSVDRVLGIGSGGERLAEVLPFYSTRHRQPNDQVAYYSLQRRPRLPSPRQRRTGFRSDYLGYECYVSLASASEHDTIAGITQLDVEATCTNRDLPIALHAARARLEFVLDGGAPVQTVRCLAGPTLPRPSTAFGDTAWALLGHLSLNYLSLSDADDGRGAEMLRHLLNLYAGTGDTSAHRQVEGVRSIHHEPVVRRTPGGGPITFARGQLVRLTLDDSAFEGIGPLRLAAVLDRFFARYVSINSFVETQLHTMSRGEIKRWPVRAGSRQVM